jgi:Domain of unknown function (DUF4349)
MSPVLLLGAAAVLLTACSAEQAPAGGRGPQQAAVMREAGGNAETRGRHIAVSHRLVIETAEDALTGAWEVAVKLCRTARCEVLSSSINNRSANAPPSASLSLRIAPEDLPKLFEQIGKSGSVLEHTTDAVDKTAAVIDVEARQRNQTQFRDRLRGMLSARTGTLKDLIEVERELARVQADLDSLAAQRKVLASQTEKVAVQIDFRPRRSAAATGVFAPVARAWESAAYVFAASLGTLLTFVVALLPWLVLIVPTIWLLVRLVRKVWRRKVEPG